MNLLIITQTMDRNDPVLGFFEGWVRALAPKFEKVTVLCLSRGEFSLPNNVSVVSLGKDEGKGRLTYLARLYRFVLSKRDEYNCVFVHMNPEYVVLAGFIWRTFSKRIVLWYNHTAGSPYLRIAMSLSNAVCHTSPFARSAGTKKSIRMPTGVDTKLFSMSDGGKRDPRSILFLGRLDPLKRPDLLLRAAMSLADEGEIFTLTFVGVPSKGNEAFAAQLHKDAAALISKGAVRFRGALRHSEVPAEFGHAVIFVNLSLRGNYDKTVIEAAASGALLLVSSDAYRGDLPNECFFREGDARDLADNLKRLLTLSSERKASIHASLRTYVQGHSLEALVRRLVGVLKNESSVK